MQHKNHQKTWFRLTMAAFAAVMVMSLMPLTVSARETGHTVLTEDYYNLSDSNAPKVPGLSYKCKGHGKEMVEYYVEEENSLWREIPGIVERVGNKLRYVKGYYCPACYGQFATGKSQSGEATANMELNIKGSTLADYFQYISEHDSAFLSTCGFYYGIEDDFEHIPQTGSNSSKAKTVAPPEFGPGPNGVVWNYINHSKALPEPLAKQPDNDDPIGNWDVTGAWIFYQFYYTGLRQIINKPADADDMAWDTVKDMTGILSGAALPKTLPIRRSYYAFAYLQLALIPLLYAHSGDGAVGVICLPMIAAFRHIFSAIGKYTDDLFCI